MTLHIFNPEHDLALACDIENYSPPAAAQKLYSDLGFIPALWADNGDVVMVEDRMSALDAWRNLQRQMTGYLGNDDVLCRSVEFVTPTDIHSLQITTVDV